MKLFANTLIKTIAMLVAIFVANFVSKTYFAHSDFSYWAIACVLGFLLFFAIDITERRSRHGSAPTDRERT